MRNKITPNLRIKLVNELNIGLESNLTNVMILQMYLKFLDAKNLEMDMRHQLDEILFGLDHA